MEQIIGLNAAQMDFLQLLAHIKTTEELEELSQIVSDYYARKAEEGMNHLWETGQWSKEKDDEVMKYASAHTIQVCKIMGAMGSGTFASKTGTSTINTSNDVDEVKSPRFLFLYIQA